MTEFGGLMQKRIRTVLIISSNYDFFMLEEDGRIDEQIFNEYVSLNLRYPPVFVKASSAKMAFEVLEREEVDLILEMLNIGDVDTFDLAKLIKESFPKIPIVVLTHYNREVSLKLQNEDLSGIDYVFCWLGNADLLLAIIKLIEDKMNAEYDVDVVGVQTIILVEDSIRYTSVYLPLLYKIILKQSREFMKEALNEHQKMLRMRGRPKILLAKTYDEALALYKKYKENVLGIISDVSFKVNNERDARTKEGLKLCKVVREEDPYIPFLLQSSDVSNQIAAQELNVGFLHKYSKTLSIELRNFIIRNFAFGEFIFRDPNTFKELSRAADLQALQQLILEIPDNVLEYHISKNDFSKWLNARAIFPVAQLLKYLRAEDFKKLDDIRNYIYEAIASFRISKGRGVIAEFDKSNYDEYLTFTRIGEGSIGGKARGLAFVNSVIKKHNLFNKFNNALITIPRTVVLSTDVFDEFMENNDLYKIGLSDLSDEEILNHFIKAKLPGWLHQDLYAFVSVISNPIAIRSSSKLEDSHYQPFAGVYSTYMIPCVKSDHALTIRMLSDAIKSVYACVYYRSSKAYMEATSNVIDEEKMGIILQEVCGTTTDNLFYPTISGVARSINFYPVGPEKPADGICNIAYGLGKYIVDGGISLRFSPRFPRNILQLSSPETILRDTQKYFYALDLNSDSFVTSTNDAINLKKLRIREAKNDPSLKHAISYYDYDTNMVRDGYSDKAKKVISFSNVLKHEVFPLAEILSTLLEVGQKEMNLPIEIEFAVDLNVKKGLPGIFNFLQIRPIVENDQTKIFEMGDIDESEALIFSNSALGNGEFTGIFDFVYVRPEKFEAANNSKIASIIDNINDKFKEMGRNYVLVGPGRWGSSDPWLGIPISWAQISEARIIVESGLANYRIDPSQGTHFFQNLTSFGVGYLTINPFINDGVYDIDFLNSKKACYEDQYVRHIRFEKEMKIIIDGRNTKGVIYKPDCGEIE
ncbi:MAG: phosphoenolpyruvate synthase [Bacteroidales bacterium]|nr:phosphoenolpyruvate synthase [Bacteroidales bacterium]MCF8389718.1 phosphoenolpyruvate synthase [Bacteroidales bacterium]